MEVKKVLVVGAGTMGHSIAQVYATAGIDVNLVDINNSVLENAMKLISMNLNTLTEFKQINSDEISSIINRIHLSTNLKDSAQDVELVVEAVNEVPDLKNKIFQQLDEYCSENTILASNTSSLNIFKIVKVKKPERLVIQHWFAPPHIIPLVEIVSSKKTSEETIELSVKLIEKLGKKPVVLKKFINSFIVNRIQNAIGGVVFELLLRNIATPEIIDTAIKHSLGIRLPIVGVVQTLDFTGLDLVSDITKSRGREISFIEEKVKQGHLGAKTGNGLYDYGGRNEEEILKKRDSRYLKLLSSLKDINAFEPI